MRSFFTSCCLLAVLYASAQIKDPGFEQRTDTLTSPPSKAALKYVNEFMSIVKQHSIFTKELDWPAIDENIKKLSKGIKTTDDARLLMGYVITRLRKAGDNHSFIQQKTGAEIYAKQNADGRKPYSKLLPGNIGYLWVPGFASISDTASASFACSIQNLISALDSQNTITGWVVDLRQNTGGNMHPMIAGLGPLIGEGRLGYFVSPAKDRWNEWQYQKGAMRVGGTTTAKVPTPYYVKTPDLKIAVLVGPSTASSGEMTAIAFIGKKNVKLIGKPTGGYTTANQGYPLSNGDYLYLASSLTADRNKTRYLGKITPDILVDETGEKGEDMALKAAESWLLEK